MTSIQRCTIALERRFAGLCPSKSLCSGREDDERRYLEPSTYLGDILAKLRAIDVRSVIAVSLMKDDPDCAVVKVIVPDLENPSGSRRRRFGPRALKAANALR